MGKDKDKGKDNVLEMSMVKKAKPLSKVERMELREKLYDWKDLIDRGKLEDATAMLPELSRCKGKWEERPLDLLYHLFLVRYHRAKGDTEAFEIVMEYLERHMREFDDEHTHYYYRTIGIVDLFARRYKDAMKAFNKAEEADGFREWVDNAFYYVVGRCLSDMGYSRRAIEYLKKALELLEGVRNRIYEVHIQRLLAYEYSRVDMHDEALKLVDILQLTEKAKRNLGMKTDGIYIGLAKINYNLKRYDDALGNIEAAFEETTQGTERFIDCMYHKALVQIACDRVDKGVSCIDEALNMIPEDSNWSAVWSTLLNALKYSVMLGNPKSLEYMRDIALPGLMEHGQYAEAIDYCNSLSAFCSNAEDTVNALLFKRMETDIYKNYLSDRVGEGV